VSVKSSAAPILNIYGLNVALGNTNFLKELMRTCVIHTGGRLETCSLPSASGTRRNDAVSSSQGGA
jgi:hypothetical protein